MLPLVLIAVALLTPPAMRRSPTIRPHPVLMEASSLADLKVYELKAVCRAKGLKVSGRKAELIERIENAPLGMAPPAPSRKPRAKGKGRAATKGKAAPVDFGEPGERGGGRGVSTAGGGGGSPLPDPPAPVTPSATPFDMGGESVRVEVVSEVEVEEEERATRRRDRRSERRAKLSQYFDEEYGKVVGELRSVAGSTYAAAFGAPEPVAIGGGVATLQVIRSERAPPRAVGDAADRGRRLAWCRGYDREGGSGVLVDLIDKSEIAVSRSALSVRSDVADEARALFPGEFVEYEPEGATLVAGGRAGEASGWVHGVMGWPLMCETQTAWAKRGGVSVAVPSAA